MKRSLAVILGGIVITVLLISVGMTAVLSQSSDWKGIVTSRSYSNESFDTWLKHFDKLIPTVILLVYLPTALLVGFLVGSFSSRRKLSCAIVALCPAWAPLLFITWRSALMSAVIAGVAVLGAWLSKWRLARIHPARQGNITS
jgi:hypothetical protein